MGSWLFLNFLHCVFHSCFYSAARSFPVNPKLRRHYPSRHSPVFIHREVDLSQWLFGVSGSRHGGHVSTSDSFWVIHETKITRLYFFLHIP